MVQICSSCNQKNSHLAEGNVQTIVDERFAITPTMSTKVNTNAELNVRYKV